jgi:hypothetical protein
MKTLMFNVSLQKKYDHTTPVVLFLRLYKKITMSTEILLSLIVPCIILGIFIYSWVTYKDR